MLESLKYFVAPNESAIRIHLLTQTTLRLQEVFAAALIKSFGYRDLNAGSFRPAGGRIPPRAPVPAPLTKVHLSLKLPQALL